MSFVHLALIGCGIIFFAEAILSAAVGRPLHRWKDSLAAVSLSSLTGLVSHFGKAFLFLLYVPLHANFALLTWSGTAWAWLGGFLAYEFSAYWFHRWSHRTNLGWAVHITHHQSEELNLSTALRTAPFRSLLDWPAILPLALLGIPPEVLVVLYIQHVGGQFWLHNQWIPRMGPLEHVLNTPSHHRVHHGCDRGYQDANYGASLILWDRLFGTFVPQGEGRPRYGVVHPVPGWDPLRATVYPFVEIWRVSRGWSRLDRLQVWLRPPGWRPDAPEPARIDPPPLRTDLVPERLGAATWHLAVGSLLVLSVPGLPSLSAPVHVLLVLLGLWTTRVFGMALEDAGPPRAHEVARGIALLLAAPLLPAVPMAVGLAAVGVITLLSGIVPRSPPQAQVA